MSALPPMPAEIRDAVEAVARNFLETRSAGISQENLNKLMTDVRGLQERIDLHAMRSPRDSDGHDLTDHIRSDGALALTRTIDKIQFGGQTLTVERDGLLDSAPANDWQRDLQRAVRDRSTARMFLVSRDRKGGPPATPKLDAKLLSLCARAPKEIRGALEKAMSDTAGSGAEWIPDIYSNMLHEDFYLPSVLESIFGVVDVAGTLVIPKISDVSRPYIAGISSTDTPAAFTPTTPTTSNQSISPMALAVRMILDQNAIEDSIIPMLEELQRRQARALSDAIEDAILNGSLTATHEDAIASWNIRSRWGSAGLGTSADHRRLWDGLRRIANARSASVDQGAGQTVAKIMEQLAGALGERGNVGTVIVTSPEVMFKKILTDTNLLTVDKAGALAATIISGNVASIAGMRVVMSRFMGADLAATGLYTGSGALSGVVAVCPEDFKIYRRRGAMAEMEKEIVSQTQNLVTTCRLNFATLTGSGTKCAAFGYNWLS